MLVFCLEHKYIRIKNPKCISYLRFIAPPANTFIPSLAAPCCSGCVNPQSRHFPMFHRTPGERWIFCGITVNYIAYIRDG